MSDQPQGGDANTARDTDDQRRLRNVVLPELQRVMDEHDVGGALFLASKDSSAWRFVLPKWSGLTLEGERGIRLRISSRTPALRAVANTTMHYVATMADMCMEGASLFKHLFNQAETSLGGPGSIEHRKVRLDKDSSDA